MKHFLDITDLDRDGLAVVMELSQMPVEELRRPLDGEGAALIFEKPSNRTRHSMEMAVTQLGGHPIYTQGTEVGIDTREPAEDIARIMAGYHRLIAARVFDHSVLVRMADAVDGSMTTPAVSVVNMLSDRSHPLQGLADLLTMSQHLGDLSGRTVAWIGDYNNVARSLGEVAAMSGTHLRYGAPAGYGPDRSELDRLAALGAASVMSSGDPRDVVRGADAVHTDTWVSMGDEDEAEQRRADFAGFCVDNELMALAGPDAIFLHCLPAYRGLEVAAEVIDGPQSVVVAQGHNRLHAARGVLAYLLGVRA
jgi:ornithine carbamoyltransferase